MHALLGENGAGKTTLMNVLYGLLQPDEGEILLDGKKVQFGSPKDAIAAGIGMVHQHFMLVPVFTVAENVTLGMEETRPSGLLDRRKARRDVRELSRRYGLAVDPDALVENLPVGIQQRVEIIKALVREASVLILDEPTAVLTPAETEDLFRIIRQLKDGGTSIVFISHKLKEVQAIADTITVLRRGAVVGEKPPSASEDELAAMMVGRSVQLTVSKEAARPGDVVLDVEDLTVADETGRVWVNGMSFQVRAGEILGLAGVQGNGQTELTEALLGLRPIASGHIRLDGRDLTHSTPRQRLHAGIAYIPEDRQEDGLVSAFSVADNMILDSYDRPPFSSGINLDLGAIASNAAERVQEFDVRTQSADTPVGTLSGGNQQKVILARELGREHKVLVASQPTRGLDVGSIEFVHRRIVQQRDHGVAVLIVSSELDEIYALADRIAVMYEGRITGFRPPSVPVEELGLLMAGSEASGAPEAGAPGGWSPGGGAGRSGRELMSEPAPPGSPGLPGPATATKQKKSRSGESRRSFGQILRESILEGNSVTVIFLAIFTAIVIGGLLNAFTNTKVLDAWGNFFSAPGAAIAQAWDTAIGAYVALFEGSIFNPHTVAALFQQASFSTAIHDGYLAAVFNPLSETCVQATPLLLAGLAVALPYQAGMFNIGAQSQFIGGAILATYLGYAVSLPPVIHVIVCVLGGFVGGAVLGWVVGELKARTGAHEVITTIMLNYIMAYLLSFLLGNVMQRPGRSDLISPVIGGNAHLPHLFGPTLRINAGFLVALACAFGVWWLLYRTTPGFEFRAIGKNPSAARVAGMNVERSWVLVMLIAGGLAGLAGSGVIQGTEFSLNFQTYGTYGFDAITVALLGLGRPLGVVLAALLFGAFHAGAPLMQAQTNTSVEIVQVLEALIVLFVAAPPLIRAIYRLRAARAAGVEGLTGKGLA